MSKRVRPVTGYEAPAGIVRKILEPKGKSRALRVTFECRQCHLLGETRWTKFHRGEVKSCGCQSKDAFFEYHRKKAQELDQGTRLRIFEKVEELGSERAGEIFRISSYLAQSIRMNIVQKLSARPDAAAIGMAAILSGSYVQVARKFDLSVWAVKALAEIRKRQLKAESDPQLDREFQLDVEEFERLIPEHQLLWDRLQEALRILDRAEYMQQTAKFGDPWDWRHPGEYSFNELHRGSELWKLRRDFRDYDFSGLPTRLRSKAVQFCSAVDVTLKNRRQRYVREARRRFCETPKYQATMLGMELAEAA